MFGLRKFFGSIFSNPEVKHLEQEVGDFFKGAADYLLHKHGPELVHIATSAAVEGIQVVAGLSLSSAEKHAQVSQIIKEAVSAAKGEFSTSDINAIIEAGYQNVQAHNATTVAPTPNTTT